MKKYIANLVLSLSVIFFSGNIFGQTITGKVSDKDGGLPGASVSSLNTRQGVNADADGNFTLKLSPGTHTIQVGFAGFNNERKVITIAEGETMTLNFVLESVNLDELVVLGSRGAARSQMDTPVPVDVIAVQDLVKNVGQVSLNQILNYVAPSFNANTQTLGDGTDHLDPASLRGLGPDQVLVLVNGKRRHTTSLININGTFGKGSVGTDLNAIPTSSIKKIEILRDGAAAQYGSDAIAGVINIILEDKVNTLNANLTTGGYNSKNSESFMDGETLQANVNFGLPILNRGGFINFAGSYDFRNPTNRQKEFTGVIFNDYNNPSMYPNPTGQDVTTQELQRLGLTRADFVSRIGQAKASGGAVSFNSIIPMGEGEFYAFGGLNYRNAESGAFRRQPAQLTQNIASIYPLGFLPLIVTDNIDQSFATGIRGKLGDWNVDFSNTYGKNIIDFSTVNSLNASLLAASPTSFEDGGYRFLQNTTNLDFNRDFSEILSGLNLAFGAEHRYENYQIVEGAENSYTDYGKARQIGVGLDGSPIYVPDPRGNVQTLQAANGGNYAGGAQSFPGFRPENAVSAKRSAVGVYTDLALDVSPEWLIDGALRFENYSDFGSTLNWKLSTRYKIGDDWALRAAASTGFRAPSLHQRYFSATSSLFVDGEIIYSGTFTNDSRPAKLLGIPELKQETSNNYSVGLTGNMGKFKLTLDGYFIRIDNRIIYTGNFSGSNAPNASPQDKEIFQLLDQANAGSARFFANAIDTKTMGLDVVLTYTEQLGAGRLKADASATFVKTNVLDGIHSSPLLAGKESTYFDRASKVYLESAVPRVKGNLTLNYGLDNWNFFLRNVYFGPVEAATNNEADYQEYAGKLITDLAVSYDISSALRATLGANNIFDVYPDKNNAGNMGAGYFPYSRSGQQYGFNGRFSFMRLSLTL